MDWNRNCGWFDVNRTFIYVIKMLAVIRHIKEHGFEKTIEKFNLKYNDYGHKVIIKYDQIRSNMEHEEVRDSRGLVLEKGTWKVMSLAFRKFFNSFRCFGYLITSNSKQFKTMTVDSSKIF